MEDGMTFILMNDQLTALCDLQVMQVGLNVCHDIYIDQSELSQYFPQMSYKANLGLVDVYILHRVQICSLP